MRTIIKDGKWYQVDAFDNISPPNDLNKASEGLSNHEKEPEPKITNMYSHGSHGGIDDEYYINEIIGLDDFTYDDWIGDKRLNKQQREEIARKYFYKERADKEKK